MSKNVIYLTKYDVGHQYCTDSMFRCTVPHFKSYAEKHNVDLIMIEPELEHNPNVTDDGGWPWVTHPMGFLSEARVEKGSSIEHEPKIWRWKGFMLHRFFSKIQTLLHFTESSYDKMLYLDSDIYINNDNENIFDEVDEGIAYVPAHKKTVLSIYRKWHFVNFGEWPEYPLVQGGLMLIVGKDNATRLCKLLELEIYKQSRDMKREKTFGRIGIDQPVFSQVFLKSKEKVKILDQKWNSWHETAKKTDNFIHYSGAGKSDLIQMLS